MMDLKAAGEGREIVSTPRRDDDAAGNHLPRQAAQQEMTADFIKVLSTHKRVRSCKACPMMRRQPANPANLRPCETTLGIILVKGRPYILCVMTTYLKDEKEGAAAIRKIAALTYSYFDRLARASVLWARVSPK